MDLLRYVLLLALLLVSAVSDVRTGRIPNAATYPAFLVGLVLALLAPVIAPAIGDVTEHGPALTLGRSMGDWAVAAAAGFIPAAILFFAFGLNGGDVKLLAAIGSLSGDWRVVLGAAVYGLAISMVIGMVLMVRGGQVRATAARLVRVVAVASGGGRPTSEAGSLKVPLAAGLAIGGAAAGVEYLLGVPFPWTV